MVLQEIRGRRTWSTMEWQVICFVLLCCRLQAISGQLRYSIPEETKKGLLVGTIAKDLNLNIKNLAMRKFRISSVNAENFFHVNLEDGNLYVSDRIDRETICETASSCSLSLEAVVENPLSVFPVKVEIQDINDNPPMFSKSIINLEVSELTQPGTKFVLVNAVDQDVGINSLQSYKISENSFFNLREKVSTDGRRYPELVLQKMLDREQQSSHEIILTALDGGQPVRTGTAVIKISVSDINDNAPLFKKDLYQVSMAEKVPVNSLVLQLDATDEDEGINGQITYSFSHINKIAQQIFSIDPQTGEIRTKGHLDFETTKSYDMIIEAEDGGGLVSHSKVVVKIIDTNDNAPEIVLSSISNTMAEDALPGTLIALINIRDVDSGANGDITCKIAGSLPFEILMSSSNYYRLQTSKALDREDCDVYNITITATDRGSPPLSTTKTIQLKVTDVNDNSPVFDQTRYDVYVPENKASGSSLFTVQASDLDLHDNGRIRYSIINSHIGDLPVSSYISINSETGDLYAQRLFDYEQLREFEVTIMAEDHGNPRLTSNVSAKIYVIDQNDNHPKILYPSSGRGGSAQFETVPRSSRKGFLVTKVVAVDADSGHNAWLSYEFLSNPDPSSFTIGRYSGEIKTSRIFEEKETLKHSVVVIVKDHGTPPLSSTVTINLVVAENFQQDVAKINSQSQNSDFSSNMNIYLVIALAAISFLFTLTVMAAIISRCRRARSSHPKTFGYLTPDMYSQVGPRFPVNYAASTLPYSGDLSLAGDSTENEFAFLKPAQTAPVENPIESDDSGIGFNALSDSSSTDFIKQQGQPNTDWRFTQTQRPGPSGTQQPTEEAGVWPNNQFETERLQAMILASANEAAEGSSAMGGGTGTMGLSARYGPQFTLQHVPDYRQNIYIPGTTSTLTNAAGKRDGKAGAPSGNKKKSGKKEKK
ncbi:protocadherin gamma-B5-like isoform X7 [Dendropsophus ebraccatus]|uniref:protocadherin gamma-B5-like isoform X7 n=1 Tax=Dendropsophus ebraccatus TaxID=150705 RepID=UPI0038322F0F